MSNRLVLIAHTITNKPSNNVKTVKIVDSAFDYLSLSDYLTTDENHMRKDIGDFVEKQITSKIVPFVEKGTFPEYLLSLLKQKGYIKHYFEKPYGYGSRNTLQGVLLAEFASGDAGIALSILMNSQLGFAISELGSQAQKKKYIPSLIDLSILAGSICKDSKQETKTMTITSTNRNKIFNGRLNYIGRSDLLFVFWTNQQNKLNNRSDSFLVQTFEAKNKKKQQKTPRLSLRILQKGSLTFQNYIIDESLRLAQSFSSESKNLNSIDILLCWLITGVCFGVYHNSIRYASKRWQFNRPIAGFQLVQQKLVKIMSNTQGMLLVCFRLSGMFQEGKTSRGVIEASRKWINEQGRQVSRLGRQLFGGNGLLHENYVMRALADIQGLIQFHTIQEMNHQNPIDFFF